MKSLADSAQFLLDRLSDFEGEIYRSDEAERQWAGRVHPAIARLRAEIEIARRVEGVESNVLAPIRDLVDACYDEMHGPKCVDEPDDERVASTIDEAAKMVDAGRITFGMIRRARAAVGAISAGLSDGRPEGWTEALALTFIADAVSPGNDGFATAFVEGAWAEIDAQWPEFRAFVEARS